MGQYYNATRISNNEKTVYNLQVNRKRKTWNGLKITEHSWWYNDFMVAFSATLVNSPAYVAWVGDYTEITDETIKNKWNDEAIGNFVRDMFVEEEKFVFEKGVKISPYRNKNPLNKYKYLVNHTKKVYIDLKEYCANSLHDGWCLHPLSLLTATSNDKGCGDFHNCPSNIGYAHVGTWCFDLIEISNNNYDYEKSEIVFKENYIGN